MTDEPGRRPQADVVPLKTDDLPSIPSVARISLARKKVVGANWRTRDFKDLNALSSEFENCDFRYSVFDRAYFRDARFTNCRFDGTRFVDCNLKGAKFYGCDFKFVHFQRCLVDVRELVASLPAEPN